MAMGETDLPRMAGAGLPPNVEIGAAWGRAWSPPQGVDGLNFPVLPSPVLSPSQTPKSAPAKDPEVHVPKLLVMKFGGSSLASPVHLRRVAGIVTSAVPNRPIVVLSAMGRTTNMLLQAADRALTTGVIDTSAVQKLTEAPFSELKVPVPAQVTELIEELTRILNGIAMIKEISPRTRDLVVSFGERLSIRVFTAFFNFILDQSSEKGDDKVGAKAVDSWEAGVLTTSGGGSADSAFSQCEVLPKSYTNLATYFEPLRHRYTHIPVVSGYVAKDKNGTITTLGRDGSDLSATIIGAAVEASQVQIWKDVNGVMTTDPRVVPSARPVLVLTYEEAAELTTFGANVVHPAAILPASIAQVPITVKNSLEPEQPGTRIVNRMTDEEKRDGVVVAMSSKRNITMVVIRSSRMLGAHGFLAHVFQIFNKFEVSIDVIATSEVTVSVTLDTAYKELDMDGLCKELEKVSQVEVTDSLAMLTLIACREDSNKVLRDAFQLFEEIKCPVEMVSHGASNVNVTFVVPDDRVVACAQKFHGHFFER